MKKHAAIMGLIAVAVLGAGIFLSSRDSGAPERQSAKPADTTVLQRNEQHVLGAKNSKVTIIEFGDYECPACGQVAPMLEQITKDYAGNPNFSFVFRNFPLSQHANAEIAAEAAEAASAQGKYWEMHDMLYAKQTEWSLAANPLDIFAGYAQKIGINVDRFKSDVQSKKFADTINSDRKDGELLGVDRTPTLYFNGKMLTTIPTYDEFKQQIEAALR